MKNCDFLFKGNRKYIHGTDLYRYLKKFFPIKFNYIDIKFHKQIKFQPKILTFKKQLSKIDYKKILLTCKITSKKEKLIAFVETNIKVKKSYPYDEKLLYPNFVIKKNEARCNFNTTLDDIDVLVSLTKYWHVKKFGKKKGQWLFSRLKLKKKFKDLEIKKIKIKNKTILFNSTINYVYVSNKLIGEIYFIFKK